MAKILHLEDNEEYANLCRGLLSHSGHEVTRVRTCEEASQAFAEGEFHLLLVDYHLEDGRNALEFVREVRRGQRHSDIPVVGLSDNAEGVSRQEADLEELGVAYSSKGSLPMIRALVETALKTKSSAQSSGRM